MAIFLGVLLVGIILIISSILFYFIIKASIRDGINESNLSNKDNQESSKSN